MKKLLLISLFGLLVSCNENKTNQGEGSESISVDSSSTGASPSYPSDNLSKPERDSAAVNDASKSGASSITPNQDSVRQR